MKDWNTIEDLARETLPHIKIAVAVDPGRHKSGCAVLMLEPLIAVLHAKRLTNEDLFDLVWELEPDLLFVEDFRLYPWLANDKRWDYFPEVRTIGALEEIARVCGLGLVEIPPAQSKNTVPNQVLYLLGTWARCHHTTDAFRVFWTVVLTRSDLEVNDGTDNLDRGIVVGEGV